MHALYKEILRTGIMKDRIILLVIALVCVTIKGMSLEPVKEKMSKQKSFLSFLLSIHYKIINDSVTL